MQVLFQFLTLIAVSIALIYGLILAPYKIAKQDGILFGLLTMIGCGAAFYFIYLFEL